LRYACEDPDEGRRAGVAGARCPERECNRALWDKVPNLLIEAMGADDPKKAAEAVQRGSECIDKLKAAGG
jgi:hypothetical protein